MDGDTVGLLIAIIVLIVLSAFFSSTETAYSCANQIKLRTLASSGSKRAQRTLELAENKFDKLISTILVGNNIVNITSATLATIFFAKVITAGSVDSSLVSTIVMTVAVLIFGEISPKLIAKAAPEKIAMAFYWPITFFYYVLYPFNLLFSGWKWLLAKIFRFKGEDVITEDEIMTIVEEAEEDGTLKKEETNLIRSVIEFDDLEVADILVPRVNIVAVSKNASMEHIKKVFASEGYSRIVVYEGTIDTIVGTIHEKDFFNAYFNDKKKTEQFMQPPLFTTEHVKISALLRQLQKQKTHLAVVLDEYGGTLGLVTLEDILEELVGEIWDEHDEEVNHFKQVDDNKYLVDGNTPLSEMMEFFDLDDDEEEFEASTVSGWIIEKLGEIPPTGKKFDYSKIAIVVTKATIKRVLQVKITKLADDEEDEKSKDKE